MINESIFNLNSEDPKEKSIKLKEEGNRFFNEEKYDKAIELYSKSILLDCTNPVFYSNRSACFLAIGDYESSYLDAMKSIEIDSNFTKGYFRAAMSLLYKDDFHQAIEIIEKCKLEESKEESEMMQLKSVIENKMKETEFNRQNFPSYERFKTFFDWLNTGGVFYPKLELKYFSDDHRGIYAKNKIQKDELLLKVPLHMLITLEMARESPIGIKMFNANLDLLSPKHCFLSTLLLQEKVKENSPWHHYLDILPKNFDNFPIFYTEEEKIWLEGSPFLQQINEKINDILQDYKMIAGVSEEMEKFSVKEFSEMRMAVSSRIFGVKINGRKTDVFAPLADMLNHKRPRLTQWFYSDDLKSFVIQATGDIHKGEEVYDSYGKKCNSRFLLNYGFIVKNNDDNEYPITIELNKKSPLYSYKINLISTNNNSQTKEIKKTFRVQANITEQVASDLFSFLRLVNFDDDINLLINLLILKKDNDGDTSSKPAYQTIGPISIKNELQILHQIQNICQENLFRYKSEYETDLKLLNQYESSELKLSNNQINCLLMRIGEKKILNFWIEFTKYTIPLFDLSSKMIKKKVKKDFPNYCPYEMYINDVILALIRMSSSNK